MPRRRAIVARHLNIPGRSWVPSKVMSKECLEKYSLLASLTILESQLNASAWLGLSVVNQWGISCLLGMGGPPKVAFGVAPPIGVLSMGSGKGCHLLGLGDCLGAGEGEMVAVSCSSMGEVLCGEMSGGDGGICPSKRWYEVARTLLSGGGLLYKMTWQVVRKSLWLLLSSSMACSSRSYMYLPCSLWSFGAWEIFWASASQMTLEQVALASWSKWLLVVLASLTATK